MTQEPRKSLVMALAWFAFGDSYKVSSITILQHGIYSKFIKEFPFLLVWHGPVRFAKKPG
jgi:hypothetical protein